jgi:hypothetical protein
MLQTILILFAAGAIGGLTLGSKVAMKEVEIMFTLARSGRVRGNKRWESIKSSFKKNRTWDVVKRNYKMNKGWDEVKKGLGKNDSWDAVKRSVRGYRENTDRMWESQRDKWSAIKAEQKRDRYDVSSHYLVNQATDKK